MTDSVTFLFFVAIWMRKKNHEILAILHYKPQGKMGKNIQTTGYYGTHTILRFFICQSKNELKFRENHVHPIIEIIDKMSA